MMGHQGSWLSLVLWSCLWIKHTSASAATTVAYNVSVTTSTRVNADTRSNVFVQIFGSTGTTEELPLSTSQAVSCHEELFWLGQTDVFIFEATNVGEIDRITLGHDGSGNAPVWYVDRVDILVATFSRLYGFTINGKVEGQQINVTEVETCLGSYWEETFSLTNASHADFQCDRDQDTCSNDSVAVLTQSEAENMAQCRCDEPNFVGFFFRADPDQLSDLGWIFDLNVAVRKDCVGDTDDDYSLTCWPEGAHACVGDYHLCKMTCGAPSGASGSAHLPILCSERSPSTWVCDSPSSTTAATPDATSTDASTSTIAITSTDAATSTDFTTPAETTYYDFTTSAEGIKSTEAITSTDATSSADATTSAVVTASADATSSAEATFITNNPTATGSFDSPTATTESTTSKPQTSTFSRTPSSSPSDSMSATPTRSPATSRDTACGRCTCQFPRQFRQNLAQVFGNQTMGEIISQLSEGLQKELTLNTSLLSSTLNKKVSKADDRLSSTYMGYLAIGIFSGILILILLSDLVNLRQLCLKRNTVTIES